MSHLPLAVGRILIELLPSAGSVPTADSLSMVGIVLFAVPDHECITTTPEFLLQQIDGMEDYGVI